MVAFVLFAAIVYLLPRNQINREVDEDLMQLSAEFQSTSLLISRDGTFRAEFDEEVDNLETAASFFMLFD